MINTYDYTEENKVYVLEIDQYYETNLFAVCRSWENVLSVIKRAADELGVKIIAKEKDKRFHLKGKDEEFWINVSKVELQ